MSDKIPIPIAIQSLTDTSFDTLWQTIAQQISTRLCPGLESITWKSIDKIFQVSESVFILSFVDGMFVVLKAAIAEDKPVIAILTSEEILRSVAAREKILDDSLLTHFAAKAKSAEAIRLAQAKSAALAKLTEEEIAALKGLGVG